MAADYVTAARAHGVSPLASDRLAGAEERDAADARHGRPAPRLDPGQLVPGGDGVRLAGASGSTPSPRAIASDFKPVMGVTLAIGVTFMLSNLGIDLAYRLARPTDPRRMSCHGDRRRRAASAAALRRGRSPAAPRRCSACVWWPPSFCWRCSGPGWRPTRRTPPARSIWRSACSRRPAAHWFGTDEMGDDILSRVIIGTRTSLWVGLVITGIAALIGVPLGIAAGYLGGICAPSSCASPTCSSPCPAWCWRWRSCPPSAPASCTRCWRCRSCGGPATSG